MVKLAVQYLSDKSGKPLAVQLSFDDWGKILNKIKKYEQTMKLRSDLKEAFEQMTALQKSNGNKQTLSDFLNEL